MTRGTTAIPPMKLPVTASRNSIAFGNKTTYVSSPQKGSARPSARPRSNSRTLSRTEPKRIGQSSGSRLTGDRIVQNAVVLLRHRPSIEHVLPFVSLSDKLIQSRASSTTPYRFLRRITWRPLPADPVLISMHHTQTAMQPIRHCCIGVSADQTDRRSFAIDII